MEIISPILTEKTIRNHLKKYLLQVEAFKIHGQKVGVGNFELIGRCYRLLNDRKYINYFEQCISEIKTHNSLKSDYVYAQLGNYYRILGENSKAQDYFNLAYQSINDRFEKYIKDNPLKPDFVFVSSFIESAVLAGQDEKAVLWLSKFPSLTKSKGLRVYPIGNYSKARVDKDVGLLITSINELSSMTMKYKNVGSIISSGQLNLMDWFEIGISILNNLKITNL